MNLITISNTINELVRQSSFFKSYHFGYHSDINRNVPNGYDLNGDAGKDFPHVTWVAPVEGEITLSGDAGRDMIDVMLFFYATQDYRNDGEPEDIERTLAWQLDRLKARAVEFLHGLNTGAAFRIEGGKVKWFTDAHAQIDRLICVGCEFRVVVPYACCDYEAQYPKLSAANVSVTDQIDLEARYVQ
jgi:hypothetical protein